MREVETRCDLPLLLSPHHITPSPVCGVQAAGPHGSHGGDAQRAAQRCGGGGAAAVGQRRGSHARLPLLHRAQPVFGAGGADAL